MILSAFPTYEQLYQIDLSDKRFVGELIASQQLIIDSIMYIRNSIFKLEPQLDRKFTVFEGVVNLSKLQYIPYYGIFASHMYKKLLYLKKDNKSFNNKIAIILPFLNEKRVYFNHKDNISQFCTLKQEKGNFENVKNKIFCLVSLI